jgi:hypothetical protein
MATPSPLNRPYASNIFTQAQGGTPSQFDRLQQSPFGANSLANRAATPVGRSNYDVNRIAERAYRQQRNPRLLMQLNAQTTAQNFARERDAVNFQQALAMNALHNQTQAQRDAQQRQYQTQDQAARQHQELMFYGLNQGAQAMEAERRRKQEEMDRQARGVTGVEMMPAPGGGFVPVVKHADGTTSLAGGYMPAPKPPQPAPSVQMMQLPGTNTFVPMYDNKPLPNQPSYTGQPVPGSYVRQATQGQPTPMQYTPIDTKPATIKVIDREGKPLDFPAGYQLPPGYKELTPQGQPAPAAAPAGGGTAPAEALEGKAGGKWQWKRNTTDTLQTGQMPAANYANDLTPEQSLAAAREHYLRTGDGSKIDEHFKQFPSQAVQFLNKEKKLWEYAAQNLDATPANVPADNRLMYAQAQRANAQYQAARQGLPIPANWEDDPAPLPPLIQPAPVPPERHYLHTAALGAENFIKDVSAAGRSAATSARQFVDYARRNPLVTIRQ